MSEKKNQHFVPKCHLKPFSFNQEGKAINLFNIANNCAYQNVPVKGQCSKNFFYGEDLGIENALAGMETKYGNVVYKIIKDRSITEEDKAFLKAFTLLQYFRTNQSIQIYMKQQKQLSEAILLGPATKTGIPDVGQKEAVILAMEMFKECFYVMEDLDACVFDSKRNDEFITSDDPAILTNKFNIQKLKQDSFGLTSSGVIYFLPLSPRYVFVAYDPYVYRIIGEKNGFCEIGGKDVDAINELQFIRAEHNIYFACWDNRNTFSDKVSKYRTARPDNWSVTEILIKDNFGDDPSVVRYRKGSLEEIKKSMHSLVAMRPVHMYPSKWPSVLKYKMKPKAVTNGSSVGYVRPPMFTKLMSEE